MRQTWLICSSLFVLLHWPLPRAGRGRFNLARTVQFLLPYPEYHSTSSTPFQISFCSSAIFINTSLPFALTWPESFHEKGFSWFFSRKSNVSQSTPWWHVSLALRADESRASRCGRIVILERNTFKGQCSSGHCNGGQRNLNIFDGNQTRSSTTLNLLRSYT